MNTKFLPTMVFVPRVTPKLQTVSLKVVALVPQLVPALQDIFLAPHCHAQSASRLF